MKPFAQPGRWQGWWVASRWISCNSAACIRSPAWWRAVPSISWPAARRRHSSRAEILSTLSLETNEEFSRCLDRNAVTKRCEEVAAIISDDHGSFGRACHFRNVRVVDAAAGRVVLCGGFQHRHPLDCGQVAHHHSRKHLFLDQADGIGWGQPELRWQACRHGKEFEAAVPCGR